MSKINLHILKSNYHILVEIQSEAKGSKIDMMMVNSYKSTVILELIYDTLYYCTWFVLDGNVLQILGYSDILSYALNKTSLSATMWSDQPGKIRVCTFSWWRSTGTRTWVLMILPPILVNALRCCGWITSSMMVKMRMGNQPGTTAMLSIVSLSIGITGPRVLLISFLTILVPFSLSVITLVTLLVKVVFWEYLTCWHVVKSLSNDDHDDYKVNMPSKSLMASDDYHKHYLNLIQKQLLEQGSQNVCFYSWLIKVSLTIMCTLHRQYHIAVLSDLTTIINWPGRQVQFGLVHPQGPTPLTATAGNWD